MMMSVRSIRPLAPAVCPQCGSIKSFLLTHEKIECQRYGYIVRETQDDGQPASVKPLAPAAVPASTSTPVKRDLSQYRPTYSITHPGGVEGFVEAAYTTAMDYVARQNWEEAIKTL